MNKTTPTRHIQQPRAKHRRRWLKRFLVTAIVLISLLLVAAVAGYAYVRSHYDQIHKISVPHLIPQASGKPFNVLLIGSDGQAGLVGPAQPGQSQNNKTAVGGHRADVMMIAHVVPATKQASLLSIPYDFFAPIAGTGGQSNKISDALNSGPGALIQTIENDLNIPINHFVEVNFAGLANIVNALGGIRVDFPYPSKDTMSGLLIPQAGCQLLNGQQALAMVRSRFFSYYQNGQWNYDPTAGFGRIHREHTFIRAAITQAESTVLTNPLRLNSFANATVNSLTIDRSLSLSELIGLAWSYRSFSLSSLNTYTLPTQIVNNYESYGDVLFPVAGLDESVIAKFLGNQPPSTASTTNNPYSSQPPSSQGSSSPSTENTIPVPQLPPGGGGSIVQDRHAPYWDPTAC
ncbi:MAG: LCP family protein [Actinobacteria bacterium]|nr:LCP family protein [Actinomycetota bacterium]MCL6105084.1 LCP family protein [Actinomycetota bacterium]